MLQASGILSGRLVVCLLVLVPSVRGLLVVVRVSRSADPTSVAFICLSLIAQMRELIYFHDHNR